MVSVDVKHQERKNFSGQVGGDKECPFNAVTNYVRVWRKRAGKRGLERACRQVVSRPTATAIQERPLDSRLWRFISVKRQN